VKKKKKKKIIFRRQHCKLIFQFLFLSNAQLIMRGSRSLGYGFVEMASDADAQAVVRALHKKTFDNREINVEIARSLVTNEELAARANKPRRRSRNRRAGDGAAAGGAASSSGNAAGGNAGGEGAGARQGGGRRRAGGNGGANGGNNNNNNGGERPLSESTVFVANLPFSLTNAELLDAFKGAKAVDAVVSCRPSGRSKGFGFVKFAKADVAAAVQSMDGKQIGDRNVTVRVAMTEFEVEKQRNDSIQAGAKDGDVPSKRTAAE
jgi:RNA recognition motif-containing protein